MARVQGIHQPITTRISDEEVDAAFAKAGGQPKQKIKKLGSLPYDPKYCDMVIEFFNRPVTREVPETWYHPDGSVKRETMREVPNRPPHIGQFAMEIGVWPWIIYKWAKEHQEFGYALNCARSLRKHMVIDNALTGLYNPIFAKLAAANWFNWSEKKEINGEVRSVMVTYHKPQREAVQAIDVQTVPQLPKPTEGP